MLTLSQELLIYEQSQAHVNITHLKAWENVAVDVTFTCLCTYMESFRGILRRCSVWYIRRGVEVDGDVLENFRTTKFDHTSNIALLSPLHMSMSLYRNGYRFYEVISRRARERTLLYIIIFWTRYRTHQC